MQEEDILAFLIKHKLLPNIPMTIRRVDVGAASYNFIITMPDRRVFCKILKSKNEEKIKRLMTNLNAFEQTSYCPRILAPAFKFNGMNGLLIEYKDGQALDADDFSLETCRAIVQAYHIFDECPPPVYSFLLPMLDLPSLKKEVILKLKAQKTCFLYGWLIRKISLFFERIPDEMLAEKTQWLQVIHGDLHAKNLLFKGTELSSFLDLEELRFGYPTEDWCRLILCAMERLMLPFHRRIFLRKQIQTFQSLLDFSKEEWDLGYYSFLLVKMAKLVSKSRKMTFWKSVKFMMLINLLNKEVFQKQI